MKTRVALLGAIFFLAAGSWSAAQTRSFAFEHLAREQGLAQASITCLGQDKQGFLWLGGEEGLVRYDGYSFKDVGFESEDPSLRTSRRVRSICVGANGELWVAFSERGLARLNPASGRLTPVPIVADGDTVPVSLNVTAVIEDREGNLWAGTADRGLFVRAARSRTFARAALEIPPAAGGRSLGVTALCQDRSGGVWAGTRDHGLFFLPGPAAAPLHYANVPDDPGSLGHDSVTALAGGADGNLWVGTAGGGLNRLVRKGAGATFVRFLKKPNDPTSLSHNDVRTLCLDRSGTLWVGTGGGGISVLEPGATEFIRCPAAPRRAGGLSNNLVNGVFQDRSGVIWIGTGSSGLDKLNPWKARFGLEQNDPDNPLSLGHNEIRGLVEDRSGTLWIGTGGGLNSWKRSTGNFFRYLPDETAPAGSRKNVVCAVHEDRKGRLWVITGAGKLLLFEPSRGRFSPRRDLGCDQDGASRILFEDRSGNLWLADSCSGLIRMSGEGAIEAVYRHDPGDPGSYTDAPVYAVHEDASGLLWLATGKGLVRFDAKSGKSLPWPTDPAVPAELLQGRICSLAEEPGRDTLWIGSAQGLYSYSFADRRFVPAGRNMDLPACEVAGIISDGPETLWLATNKGLIRVHPRTNTFKIFTVEDGLQADIFNVGAIIKGRGGEIFAGGDNGLNWFQPREILENPHVPAIVLTDVRTAQNVPLVRPRYYPRVRELSLYVRDAPFTLIFSALDFADPAENRYSFRLQGKSGERLYKVHDRALNLGRMSPGLYTLRVTGANGDGVWNQEGLTLALRIVPPFWQTRRFGAIVGLMLLALALYLLWMRRRMRRAKRAGIPENLDEILARFAISRREADVLRLLLAGKSNKEIEGELHIAMATVKIHVHNIFRKMDVGDRLHLLLRIQAETQEANSKKDPPAA